MHACRLGLLCVTIPLLIAGAYHPGREQPPRQVRIVGPDMLQRGTRNLIHVESIHDGKTWKRVAPDQFSVKVTGAASVVADPAAKPMNPFEVRCEDVATGEVTV